MRNIFKLFSLANDSDTPIGLSAIRNEKKPIEEHKDIIEDEPELRWLKINKL